MSWSNDEEFISFLIASQPCPPLPLITLHVESGDNDKITNSHDLLFAMMRKSIDASANLSAELKLDMKNKKRAILERLERKICEVDTACSVETDPTEWKPSAVGEIYKIFCEYFQDMCSVYMFGEERQFNIVQLDEMNGKSKIGIIAAGHFKGLCLLTRMDGEDWDVDRLPVMNLSVKEIIDRGYSFTVCLYAHKIRLERAGII